MSMRNYIYAMVLILVSGPASLAFVVDGDLSDWGVTVADNNLSNFNNVSLTTGVLAYHIDDQSDTAGDGAFGRANYSGQDYDAEMMAIAYQDNKFFIAIVTGQRPDNGFARFAPGDIRIETNLGVYGIEVGGGWGDGPGQPITEGAPGSTYKLHKNGFTKKYDKTSPLQTAGSIWTGADWLDDPISPKEPVQLKIDTSSQQVGTADFIYTRDAVTKQHSIIELAIGEDVFSGSTIIQSIHWQPAGGQDELQVSLRDSAIPEPISLMLLVSGGLAIMSYRRHCPSIT